MSKIIEYLIIIKKKYPAIFRLIKTVNSIVLKNSKIQKPKYFLTNQYLIIFKSIGKGISAEGFSHPNPKSVLLKFPPIIQIIA